MGGAASGRLLTFNCHEGYVHLLGKLGVPMDVVDGLPGRYVTSWDTRMRPVPPCARLVRLEEVRDTCGYDAVVAHNVRDLLDVKEVDAPKILVLHVSLAARVLEEPGGPSASDVSRQLAQYLGLVRGTAVAVSEAKRASWGLDCEVVRPAVDETEWSGHDGKVATLLRVGNQVGKRRARFGWDDHERLVSGLSFRLVGYNPDLPGVRPSESWDDLRGTYRAHRAYVHTAGAGLDDGYNLALLEAMATGMPAVSTVPSESPIVDGETGFVGTDIDRLRDDARRLLDDPGLARRVGDRARESVLERFALTDFVAGWHRVIEKARARWGAGRGASRHGALPH